jgi:hypothetical protein
VVEIRPNIQAPGYVPASLVEESLQHVAGDGTAAVDVQVLDNNLVPDGFEFRITFQGFADSARADSYSLIDETSGRVLFELGRDFEGAGTGPVGLGLQPVINTPPFPMIDEEASGFTSSSNTNAVIAPRYSQVLPRNLRRPGYPEDLLITFSDQFLDTTLAAIGSPAQPVKFKVETESGLPLDIRFVDTDGDGTLSAAGEVIEVVTYESAESRRARPTWNISLDMEAVEGDLVPPTSGDEYALILDKPIDPEDEFVFTVQGERLDEALMREDFDRIKPYVVPNPYAAAASFEPERFATSGRGVRRMEFRGVPVGSTVRIYTIRGELVQTLEHDGVTRNPDGSVDVTDVTGMIPWDLRSKDNLEVAPGLYIYHVDSDAGEHVGKFAIIK